MMTWHIFVEYDCTPEQWARDSPAFLLDRSFSCLSRHLVISLAEQNPIIRGVQTLNGLSDNASDPYIVTLRTRCPRPLGVIFSCYRGVLSSASAAHLYPVAREARPLPLLGHVVHRVEPSVVHNLLQKGSFPGEEQ